MNPNARNYERGSVLMSVILMLAILAIFTVAVNRQASQQLILGPWVRDRVMARGLANAGVARAMLEIQADKFMTFDALNETWASNEGAFHDVPLGGGSFSVECPEGMNEKDANENPRYGLCDESGRINVNLASEDVLTRLVLVVSNDIEEGKAREIAQSIVDWRDGDDAQLAGGAESTYYRSLAAPYVARNSNLESVDELLMIRGIDQKLYSELKPFITVFGKAALNINTASSIALQAIGFSPNLAQAIVEFRKGADAISGNKDDEIFQDSGEIASVAGNAFPLNAEDHEIIESVVNQGLVTTQSNIFRIRSIGRLKKDESHSYEHWITCVVTRNGSILYWHEGEAG